MLTRAELSSELAELLRRHGNDRAFEDATILRDLDFRSLDFSELALQVEDRVGRELNFGASAVRAVNTVGDLLDFLDEAQRS